MGSYNRFSHHAQRALTHAGLLVQRFHHPRVDTGHLLVGVLLSKGSLGHAVLVDLDLHPEPAQTHLESLTLPLDHPVEDPPNDAALDIALELAADESHWLGHHYIGTEHLLLGITRTNIGNASDLLRAVGIPADLVRRRVRRALNDGVREDTLERARHDARLSELSKRVLNAAEQMAVQMDHETVGLGHLLVILHRERRATTARLLQTCDLDRELVEQRLQKRDAAAFISLEDVLFEAVEYAQNQGSHYTGTEHLLWGILAHPVGEHLLHHCGVKITQLRDLLQTSVKG